MITFYDSKGKIVLSAQCSEETRENLLSNPEYAQYSYVDEYYHPDKYYVNVTTKELIAIPDRPSPDYTFSYDSYSWEVNTARATKRMRNIRDGLLSDSDWTDTLSSKNRLGEDLYNQWQAYRQALRDVPEQAGFPLAIVWPTPPE
jgi:hypothetical protein